MIDDWDELGFPAPQPRVYHDPEPILPRPVHTQRQEDIHAARTKWRLANPDKGRDSCKRWRSRWRFKVMALWWFTKTTAFPRFRKKR